MASDSGRAVEPLWSADLSCVRCLHWRATTHWHGDPLHGLSVPVSAQVTRSELGGDVSAIMMTMTMTMTMGSRRDWLWLWLVMMDGCAARLERTVYLSARHTCMSVCVACHGVCPWPLLFALLLSSSSSSSSCCAHAYLPMYYLRLLSRRLCLTRTCTRTHTNVHTNTQPTRVEDNRPTPDRTFPFTRRCRSNQVCDRYPMGNHYR